MIKECIILAGGLGTRLREAVPDLPKCMAPVAGRPFLFHVINYLRSQGIDHFIFSVGYKHEMIEAYLQASFSTLHYTVVIEDEPLGTGGAIRLACTKATGHHVLVTNGDTLFRMDVSQLEIVHERNAPLATLALKPMNDFDRYGAVQVEGERITGFAEKKFYNEGLINGGTYLVDVPRLMAMDLPVKFSFETDVLDPQASAGQLAASVQDAYFIDIGIPEDYKQADTDLALPPLDLAKVDKNWTLFLDRDGVINVDHPGTYIFVPKDFVFLPGAPGLFKKLAETFKYIVIATNQRGVGRKLMTNADLDVINNAMIDSIREAGGDITKVYAATAMDNADWFRKPNPGMANQAKRDFPAIDLRRSIMVGNNLSDMEFGKNAGMYTVFLTTTLPEVKLPHPDIDLIFPLLNDFAKALTTAHCL